MLISRSCRSTLTRLYALGTPAATVVLLRNGSSPGDVQCLLVQKAKAKDLVACGSFLEALWMASIRFIL